MRETSVMCIGNALVDLIARVDCKHLEKIGFEKGTMNLVNEIDSHLKLLKGIELIKASGGSAANVATGISFLKGKSSFIGTVGKDDFGKFYENDLKKTKTIPLLEKSNNKTGTTITYLTPDAERTFATFLGASQELNENNFKTKELKAKILHIEGFLLLNPSINTLMQSLIQKQKAKNCLVSLDLNDKAVIQNTPNLFSIIKNSDIVFCNEQEAKAINENPLTALKQLSRYCGTAVLKLGKKGSIAMRNGKIIEKKINPVKAIDSTGAGDAFAAGFLHETAQQNSIEQALETASILSAKAVQKIGARV